MEVSLKDAIQAAKDEKAKQQNPPEENTESGKEVNTDLQKAVKSDDTVSSLTIKVSRRQRLHWLISAKKEGITLTQAITDALKARYGDAPEE